MKLTRQNKTRAFTLIELMVVILIIGILAAASVPMMRGRIDAAKWAEANATAGSIRSAVQIYFAEHASSPTGLLSNATTQSLLGFTSDDLTGAYFVPGDYNIDSVDADGNAAVTVTGSQSTAPTGSKTLSAAGSWN